MEPDADQGEREAGGVDRGRDAGRVRVQSPLADLIIGERHDRRRTFMVVGEHLKKAPCNPTPANLQPMQSNLCQAYGAKERLLTLSPAR